MSNEKERAIILPESYIKKGLLWLFILFFVTIMVSMGIGYAIGSYNIHLW